MAVLAVTELGNPPPNLTSGVQMVVAHRGLHHICSLIVFLPQIHCAAVLPYVKIILAR